MGTLRLNVGSGDLPAPPPWVNVEVNAELCPDVVASVVALPFSDGEAEAVYCGHVLEHLDLDREVPTALVELRRVLRDGGSLCVVGPDYDRALADFPDPVLLEGIRNGAGRWQGDEHRWLSTGHSALHAIRRAFPDAVDVPIAELGPFWPVASRVGWQFAATATA